MKNIKYKVLFFSEWHCGSGLAAGADKDALVVKDRNKLPFIPGKTMKGLIREAVEDIYDLRKLEDRSLIVEMFGNSIDRNNKVVTAENDSREYVDMVKGVSFFTNVQLSAVEQNVIAKKRLADFLYRAISSTAIDSDGIAQDFSLRRMETVVPCSLEGEILNVPDKMSDVIVEALKYIKRLGANRNRGLGRCEISILEKEDCI